MFSTFAFPWTLTLLLSFFIPGRLDVLYIIRWGWGDGNNKHEDEQNCSGKEKENHDAQKPTEGKAPEEETAALEALPKVACGKGGQKGGTLYYIFIDFVNIALKLYPQELF